MHQSLEGPLQTLCFLCWSYFQDDAGHSFYIGPIGFFYYQVNDTGSWEPLVLYCYGQIFSCFIFIKPLLFQTQKTYFLLWYWFVSNRMTPYLTMHENVCLCFWVFCASDLFSGFCNNSTVYNINVIKTGSVIFTNKQKTNWYTFWNHWMS